jgi:DNA ligase 1
MKRFAALYDALDATTGTNAKVAALAAYCAEAPAEDAAWAVHFLTGRRPRRLAASGKLQAWAAEAAGVEPWLFGECYHAVGDLAETISLLLPPAASPAELPLHRWIEDHLLPLQQEDEAGRRRGIEAAWRSLARDRPLRLEQADHWRLPRGRVAEPGRARARAEFRRGRRHGRAPADGLVGPVAGVLPRALRRGHPRRRRVAPVPLLPGPSTGVRAVGARRRGGLAGRVEVGRDPRAADPPGRARPSSGREERSSSPSGSPSWPRPPRCSPTGRCSTARSSPGSDGHPLPFSQLQRRIGRKTLGPKILREVPVVLLCYDLLELDGADLRGVALVERRARLETLLAGSPTAGRFLVSPTLNGSGWDELALARESSRERAAEGLMLKRLGSPYGAGRRRGDWWKWKVEPFTADAVLVYAQRGSGRRASLYTDYTFAVWDDGRRAGPLRQGVFRPDRRRDPQGRFVREAQHSRAVRPGPHGAPGAGLRARVRGDPAEQSPQERPRRALPAHPPLADRQAAGGRRHAGHHPRAAGGLSRGLRRPRLARRPRGPDPEAVRGAALARRMVTTGAQGVGRC